MSLLCSEAGSGLTAVTSCLIFPVVWQQVPPSWILSLSCGLLRLDFLQVRPLTLVKGLIPLCKRKAIFLYTHAHTCTWSDDLQYLPGMTESRQEGKSVSDKWPKNWSEKWRLPHCEIESDPCSHHDLEQPAVYHENHLHWSTCLYQVNDPVRVGGQRGNTARWGWVQYSSIQVVENKVFVFYSTALLQMKSQI